MLEERRFRLQLSGPAPRDFASIDRYTTRNFGGSSGSALWNAHSPRLGEILEDPACPGAESNPQVFGADVRLYHLSMSRERGEGDVKHPRHLVLYRQRPEAIIEILRILHDSRDLARHMPA